MVRHVARGAGLIRLYRKRYLPTRRAVDLLDRHGAAGVYPVLLRAFATEFDWSSMDGYPQLSIVQKSWLFTAYLLTRHGDTPNATSFYSAAFLRAFPHALDVALDELAGTAWFEFYDDPVEATRERVLRTFRTRALTRFAAFLGLVRIEQQPGSSVLDDTYRVNATPLLRDAIRFQIGFAET